MFTVKLLAVTWAGSFIGALAAGGAGFAFALAASSIWLHALDPLHTTAFVVASGTILHTGFVWQMRKTIETARLIPFLVGGLIGIPVGVHILAGTDGSVLRKVLSFFLLIYGAYALFSPQLPRIWWGGRFADAAIGFIGGLLGGLGGFSGVLPTIWTQIRGWSKEEARGVYQPYILAAQVATLLLVGGLAFDKHHALLFLTTMPFLLLGGWIGWLIYGKLDERRFKQVLALLIIVSGGALAFKEIVMQVDMQEIEKICKALYIQALKILPPDIKAGFQRLARDEDHPTGRTVLGVMVENIAVAERTNNLLCQDTGIPIYNVTIGKGVLFDGVALKKAIRRGCERATREHPLRSSVVHPITRHNEHSSCGERVPIIHIDFDEREETVEIEMIPKGSGSENGSFLKMLIPADGTKAIKRFVVDRIIELGGRVCPPTIVGVGVGGTSDLCMHLAKIAATRPLGTKCSDDEGAKLEAELSEAANSLGIGPQGLGGRSTSFAVHVETAATHITMNPVAVNIQCHSARRATATITPDGIAFR